MLTSLIGYQWGSTEFYVVAGITLFTVLVLNSLLVGLFGSQRGCVLGSVVILLPVGVGLIACAATELYVVPNLEAGAAAKAPLFAFGLSVVGTIMMVTKRLLGLNLVISTLIFGVTWVVGAGAFSCSDIVIEFLDQNATRLEQHEEPAAEVIGVGL